MDIKIKKNIFIYQNIKDDDIKFFNITIVKGNMWSEQ